MVSVSAPNNISDFLPVESLGVVLKGTSVSMYDQGCDQEEIKSYAVFGIER